MAKPRPEIGDALWVWIWYQSAKSVENLADHVLDELFLTGEYPPAMPLKVGEPDKRSRILKRVKKFGYEPKPSRNGTVRAFVEGVKGLKDYKHTIDIWNSEARKFLSVEGCSAQETADILHRLAKRFRLHRFTDSEVVALRHSSELRKRWKKEITTKVGPSFAQLLRERAKGGSVHDLTFIIAAYTEAVSTQQFERAIVLRDALLQVTLSFIAKLKMDIPLASLTIDLIELRVLGKNRIEQVRIPVPIDWSPFVNPRGDPIGASKQRLLETVIYSRDWFKRTKKLSKDLRTGKKQRTGSPLQYSARDLIFHENRRDPVRRKIEDYASNFDLDITFADEFTTSFWGS